MRFSSVLLAGTLLLVPGLAPAQDAEPAEQAEQAEPAEQAAPAAEAAAPDAAFVEEGTCPDEVTAERAASFGEPSARLDPEQAVYTPSGLSVLGNPVAYVIVGRAAGSDAVVRLAYRLAGVDNGWGADYRPALRAAFDEAFNVEICGEAGSTCMFEYNNAERGKVAGAELSNRAQAIPPGAEGEAMPLLEADYDLEGADPVYLVCRYEVG